MIDLWDLYAGEFYWRIYCCLTIWDNWFTYKTLSGVFFYNAVENDGKKSVPEEVMTEEIESVLLKEYPQLPVARQNEGEIKFLQCTNICLKKLLVFQQHDPSKEI